MEDSKTGIIWVLLLGGILPVVFGIGCDFLFPNLRWVELPFHSVLESLGLFAGVSLAVLLLSRQRNMAEASYYIWVIMALIGMGLLDGFHASVPAGNTFVWLHSLAILVGGSLFSLVWFSGRAAKSQASKILPGFVAVIVILIGIFSMTYPEKLPAMLVKGNFTHTASMINGLGGIFFIMAAIFFMIRPRVN